MTEDSKESKKTTDHGVHNALPTAPDGSVDKPVQSEDKKLKLEHYPFPKIRGFKDVVYELRKARKGDLSDTKKDAKTIEFYGQVKIHGCNSALVQRPDGVIYGQGRNRVLAEDYGNQFEFVEWYTHEARLAAIKSMMTTILDSTHPKRNNFTWVERGGSCFYLLAAVGVRGPWPNPHPKHWSRMPVSSAFLSTTTFDDAANL